MLKTRLAVALLAALALARAASGQVIFDANFNAQPLGPLADGAAPDYPGIIRDPGTRADVVASAGDLADKPVVLQSTPGGLACVAFDNPAQLASGKWRVSWDSLVLDRPVDDSADQHDVVIVANSGGTLPSVWGIKYFPTGQFVVEDGGGFHAVGGYSIGRSDHFDLDLDLDLDGKTYDLSINRAAALAGGLGANGEFLFTYFRSNGRFLDAQLPRLAFDNVKVVGVPETSAFALPCLAAAPLLRRQRRARLTP